MPISNVRTGPLRHAGLAIALACSVAATSATGNSASGGFVIRGNSGVPTEDVNAAIRAALGAAGCPEIDSVCIRRACESVGDLYWGLGYLDAAIDCQRIDVDSNSVAISIREGLPSAVRSIHVGGVSPALADSVECLFAVCRGEPFSRGRLEQAIDDVLSFYDERGHPASRVELELVSLAEGWVSLDLKVDEGPRATLGYVIFRGAARTRHDVLLREAGLRVGEAYRGPALDQARARLLALGVFEEVSDAALTFDRQDSSVVATFDVVEARSSFFEGVLGYAPSGRGGQVVGSFDVGTSNLGGALRKARVAWIRRGSGRLAWSIYYREPRILSRPFAFELRVASDVVDTSYARRRLAAGITFVGEPRLELGLGGFLGATKDRSSGAASFGEKGLSSSLVHDGRDDADNPRRGTYCSLSHEIEWLDYDAPALTDQTLSTLVALAEYVLPVAKRAVAAVAGRFEGVFSGTAAVPPSHMRRLGGAGSIRGYPEEWFVAEKAAVASVELRWLFGDQSRVYVFGDAATLEDRTHDFGSTRNLPIGYGLGLVGGATSGLVRLEIALGRDDSWRDAKVHLGLLRRF